MAELKIENRPNISHESVPVQERNSTWLAKSLDGATIPPPWYASSVKNPRPSFYDYLTNRKGKTVELKPEEIAALISDLKKLDGVKEESGSRAVAWKQGDDGSWLFAYINGGRQHREDPTNSLRLYLNLNPRYIPQMMKEIPLYLRDRGVRGELKAHQLGDWDRDDSIVIYLDPSQLKETLGVIRVMESTAPDAFIPNLQNSLSEPITIGGKILTGVSLSQNPPHTKKGESQSFNSVRAEALNQALTVAEKDGSVILEKENNPTGKFIGWKIKVVNQAQWESHVQKALKDADVDPNKIYLNLSTGDKIQKIIEELKSEVK